jgi:hypothetical protein
LASIHAAALAHILRRRTLALDAYSMLGSRAADLGRLTALAGVTLAAAAVSAWSRYAPLLSLLCLGSAGCLSRRARRPHAITIALLTG